MRLVNRPNEACSGIADRRRSCVRHDHNAPSGAERFDDRRRAPGLVVSVQGHRLRDDSVAAQQRQRPPGIFGGDGIDGAQDIERAERHISCVAERRRDHI